MQEFFAAGGVPALVAELSEVFELDAVTGSGRSWAEESEGVTVSGAAIRPVGQALADDGAFAVVRGSLAPDGGLLKTSAASPRLFRHRGPAVVFSSYDEMRERIDDPRARGHARQRAGTRRRRPGGCAGHARVGARARAGATRGSRRRRHGAGDRWANERHGLWHLRAARDPRGGDRRPARAGARRRSGRARRGCRARSTSRYRPTSWPSVRRAGSRPPAPTCGAGRRSTRSTSPRPTSAVTLIFSRRCRQTRGLVEPVIGRS